MDEGSIDRPTARRAPARRSIRDDMIGDRVGRHARTARERPPSGVRGILQSSIGALATLLAAGCSLANLSGAGDTRNDVAPEPDYRKIVAAGIKVHLKEPASFGPLEISAIKRTVLTQSGDWMVCVKGVRNDRPVYFGVFMREHAIVRFEESVAIDRCGAEQYEPLPSP